MDKMYNKRGQLTGDTMTFFISVVFIAIILLVFYFLAGALAKSVPQKEKLDAFSLRNEAQVSLNAYLNTPVKIDYAGQNSEIKIFDLIRLASLDSKYKTLLETETKAIFDKVYGENWEFEIKDLILLPKIESVCQPATAECISDDSFKFTKASTITIPNFEISLYLKNENEK